MAKRVSCHYNSNMRKYLTAVLVLLFLLAAFYLPQKVQAGLPANAPAFSAASQLIDGVNAVRSSEGRNTLQSNSILNSIAQQQAEYELSIGSQTDTGAGGSHPYQRALAAGYLLAGDLSKGGIIAFTKTLALEMAKYNITANSIAPGYTSTEMVEAIPEEVAALIKAKIPLGRFASPEEIAKAAGFLAVDADYITGQELNVNGGCHM